MTDANDLAITTDPHGSGTDFLYSIAGWWKVPLTAGSHATYLEGRGVPVSNLTAADAVALFDALPSRNDY